MANWYLKVSFILSYKRSPWVGKLWLVWQRHSYWWSKAPSAFLFCLSQDWASVVWLELLCPHLYARQRREEGKKDNKGAPSSRVSFLSGHTSIYTLLTRVESCGTAQHAWRSGLLAGPLPPRIESASRDLGRKDVGWASTVPAAAPLALEQRVDCRGKSGSREMS